MIESASVACLEARMSQGLILTSVVHLKLYSNVSDLYISALHAGVIDEQLHIKKRCDFVKSTKCKLQTDILSTYVVGSPADQSLLGKLLFSCHSKISYMYYI